MILIFEIGGFWPEKRANLEINTTKNLTISKFDMKPQFNFFLLIFFNLIHDRFTTVEVF